MRWLTGKGALLAPGSDVLIGLSSVLKGQPMLRADARQCILLARVAGRVGWCRSETVAVAGALAIPPAPALISPWRALRADFEPVAATRRVHPFTRASRPVAPPPPRFVASATRVGSLRS
jgi:hypothetical protein